MDEHRPQTTDKPAPANANGDAPAGAKAATDRNDSKTHQPPRTVEKEGAHAKDVVGEVIDRAKSAAGDAVASMAEDLGEQAQDVARRARDQAAATSKAARDYLSRNAATRPLSALLVAGAVGYALAYLIHRR